MTYKLRIKDEDGKATVVPMNKALITVGRGEAMIIRLTEKNVSREHARITTDDDGVYVEDTSRYGTTLNGSRFKGEKKRVEPGDILIIGDYELSVEGKAKAAAKSKPKAAPAPAPAPARAKSRRSGGPSGDTSMISLDELAKRERAAGRRRVEVDVPTFFVLNTDLKGTELPITSDEVTLGRESGADIQVNHTSISAVHAAFSSEDGKYRLEDLGSSNGIKINGEYYERSVLRRGDVIELGHVRMRFIEPGEVFVYNPDDYDDDDDATFGRTGGSNKGLFLFLSLIIVAGGLAAAYFLYWGKDTDLTEMAADSSKPKAEKSQTSEPAKTAKVEPGVTAAKPAVAKEATEPAAAKPEQPKAVEPPTTPVEPEQPATKDDGVTDIVEKGKDLLRKEKWDEAATEFKAALAKDAGATDAKEGLATARSEKAVKIALASVTSKVTNGDLKGAWLEAGKTPAPGATSVYNNRYTSLVKGVKTSYLKSLIDQGNKALKAKQWQDALNAANEALGVDDDNSRAKRIKGKAARELKKAADRRRRDEAKKPEAKKPETKKPEAKKPETKKPAATSSDGLSAKELYREGRRKLSAGDKSGALSLFQKAASKGYSKAYKLMGNIYLQQGQTGKAKSMYKKYLRLRPGASDAEAIKATIIRLGG